MLAVSLKTQLEKAIAASEGVKHLEGNIKSTAELFAPGALVLLEDRFRAFAFLAFDPAVDNASADYVRGGGMGSDSGPNILALFLLDQEATWPVQVDHASFNGWLDIDSTIHPSHQVLRFLFEPEEVPPLPGIAIFRTFTLKSEAIYVPCVGCGHANDVRAQCRRIFSLVDLAARDD